MFAWLGVNEKFRNATNMILRVFQKWLENHDSEISRLMERVDELEKVQKTLSDDMYDVQADLTLIHNIEGYEDWRSDIGKPISKPTDIVK